MPFFYPIFCVTFLLLFLPSLFNAKASNLRHTRVNHRLSVVRVWMGDEDDKESHCWCWINATPYILQVFSLAKTIAQKVFVADTIQHKFQTQLFQINSTTPPKGKMIFFLNLPSTTYLYLIYLMRFYPHIPTEVGCVCFWKDKLSSCVVSFTQKSSFISLHCNKP